jgi:hypothetical protein
MTEKEAATAIARMARDARRDTLADIAEVYLQCQRKFAARTLQNDQQTEKAK